MVDAVYHDLMTDAHDFQSAINTLAADLDSINTAVLNMEATLSLWPIDDLEHAAERAHMAEQVQRIRANQGDWAMRLDERRQDLEAMLAQMKAMKSMGLRSWEALCEMGPWGVAGILLGVACVVGVVLEIMALEEGTYSEVL